MESRPSTTTFVETDPQGFREVVQKLTGVDPTSNCTVRPVHDGPRRKLLDRLPRARKLEIKLGVAAVPCSAVSPFKHSRQFCSSPVTGLESSHLFSPEMASKEEKTIANKDFCLHPSPRNGGPPELLLLFPLTSPKQVKRRGKSIKV